MPCLKFLKMGLDSIGDGLMLVVNRGRVLRG